MSTNQLQKIERLLQKADCRYNNGGNNIQAQCPAHYDQNPSLSINEDSKGNIGIYCHAGCNTKDVLQELGIEFRDLYPGNSNNQKNNIIATYPYLNAGGKLLYQAVRLHPKQFRYRQPDVGGRWTWNIKAVKRVPYNLPQVQTYLKKRKPIFIVEGEKDAETLISKNLCGTTAPMGAGKWREDYNKYFKDGEVIILPDNDRLGKEHAAAVAKQLRGITKSVGIVLLPDLEEKGDVSDWLEGSGTRDELLEMAFNSTPIISTTDIESLVGLPAEIDVADQRSDKDFYFEEGLKLYSKDENEVVIADFNIELVSIVKDDELGQLYYIKIKEMERGIRHISETIEIEPHCLDHKHSFYKAIRPYSVGQIKHHRNYNTKPLKIFKWLREKFEKPIVRRPDHLGLVKGKDKRPFWVFCNALVCPPWNGAEGKIVEPNSAGEFIIGHRHGLTLPLYESEAEKKQLAPQINTNFNYIEQFIGEVKTKLVQIIGGGDPNKRAHNYGKLLLAYIIYHLYEDELYKSNDFSGHTILFYVFGPKGTGKTTYFNTVLQSFFGLQHTKNIKGNSVSIPGLENMMGMYGNMPVCYDEFNPEDADLKYQHINSYYHKTSRSVSDIDRRNRNKFINIRSSLCITSNYPINLDEDQADTTKSRTIYFQYKKEYRSEDQQLFDWVKNNLHRFSAITAHWLLNQTDKKRKVVKEQASKLYLNFKERLNAKAGKTPNRYEIEHRLTDNYTRLLACYELIFGQDEELRDFIFDEILGRFSAAKAGNREDRLINHLKYLASSGSLKESWHYHYKNSKKELCVDISQCHQAYEECRKEKALSTNQFRESLKEYFDNCGGYEAATRRWTGKYQDDNHQTQKVQKTQHSYILTYRQVNRVDNALKDIFPPDDKHREVLNRMK